MITELAERQLSAYNAADLDAFVACYHEEVRVLNGESLSLDGIQQFRERYRPLFEGWSFGAAVPKRMALGMHCFDYETWWRIDPENGERTEGEIIVRYELRDERIGTVQFFRKVGTD